MRTALLSLTLLAAACGDDPAPTGTFSVSWSLSDPGAPATPTCDTYKIADVVVTTKDGATGDTHMISAPCSAGMVATEKLELGDYGVTVSAMGTAGDEAGKKEIVGTLATADQVVTLAPAAIEIAPPVEQSRAVWSLKKNGVASSCSAFPNSTVEITTTPEGQQPVIDLWDCTPSINTAIDVPYGAFTVQGRLLDSVNAPLATTSPIDVDAHRGTITVQVDFVVP